MGVRELSVHQRWESVLWDYEALALAPGGAHLASFLLWLPRLRASLHAEGLYPFHLMRALWLSPHPRSPGFLEGHTVCIQPLRSGELAITYKAPTCPDPARTVDQAPEVTRRCLPAEALSFVEPLLERLRQSVREAPAAR